MAWATTSGVLGLTGATVTDGQITQAQGVVELLSGVTEDNTELADRDLRMLTAATAYQAAWQAAQVDVTTRTDVARLEQDGAKVEPSHPDALILAPLARRALDRLTWRQRGSVRITGAGTALYRDRDAYAAAWLRDETLGAWSAL